MADIAATHSKGKDDWQTPLPLFHNIEWKFGQFDLDPCTTADNPLSTPIFFTEKEDGLVQPWRGHVFVNPPYSQISLWVKKAWEEAKTGRANVVMLVAARPDTQYWWEYLRHGEVYFIKGRVKFVGAAFSAPFPSALVNFRMPFLGWTHYLDIPKEVRIG